MTTHTPLMNIMTMAAEKAGRSLIHDFGEVEQLQVSKKGPADFVSNADRQAEEIIHQTLVKARPDYGFLMEESGEIIGKDLSHRWIIDPLDGTTNFLHGLPHFAVSIALEEAGEIIAGIVYDPVKDEIFTAEKGAGAFLNNRRIRVSGRTRLSEAIFATGIPYMGHLEKDGEENGHQIFLKQLPIFMAKTAGVRRWGAAALDLAYVAAGRVDGFWEKGLQPWDAAAGVILVREAGGFVSDSHARPLKLEAKDIVAANAHLHSGMLDLLKSVKG